MSGMSIFDQVYQAVLRLKHAAKCYLAMILRLIVRLSLLAADQEIFRLKMCLCNEALLCSISSATQTQSSS